MLKYFIKRDAHIIHLFNLFDFPLSSLKALHNFRYYLMEVLKKKRSFITFPYTANFKSNCTITQTEENPLLFVAVVKHLTK